MKDASMMISPAYVGLMARYSRWQNDNLVETAAGLSDPARRADRGGFFKSIHETFCHLLWGDQIWLSRFADFPPPDRTIDSSATLHADWAAFVADRAGTNDAIDAWAQKITQAEIDGELRWYSGLRKRDMVSAMAPSIVHFFNHGTHHRGQIHAMLTNAKAEPGVTDLILMPEDL